MSEFLITCKGFEIGNISIPAFKVKKGQLLCFHWLLPRGSLEEEQFWEILLGIKAEVNFQVFGKITKVINLPYKKRRMSSYLFYRQTIEKIIMESENIDAAQVNDILTKLNITPNCFINSVSLTTKILLGIELACIKSPDAIVFETSGLDPLGIDTVCQTISGKLNTCAAIQFSYPTIPSRICCSQSQCLEVKQANIINYHVQYSNCR